MKKKILLVSLMVVMLVCALAICVSAAYTPATAYNYYKDSVADENLLYSVTTQMDPTRGRFEMTVTESGVGFARYDDQGNPISWYVDSAEVDANGARNIVVKSALTIGGVGTVDENGLYTFGGGTVEGVTSKTVVSVNFFGTGVKTLPDEVFMSTATDTPHASEYTVFAGGTELLCLYLPKTLTAFPARMCTRSAVRVIEFEDNQVACTQITGVESLSNGSSPFAFCGNLKAITIPEGIETINKTVFRENCSLTYVKFPSTMTRLENNVFMRCNAIETVVLGPNMTYAGMINTNYSTMKNQGVGSKYYWVPNTINTANSYFDNYRGDGTGYLAIEKNIVFLFAGTEAEATTVGNYTKQHFKAALSNTVSYSDYILDKEHYDTEITGHLLVYDVPTCIAFYDGHDLESNNTYTDALTSFNVGEVCKRCGDASNATSYDPILTFLGYSAQIGGDLITFGYQVNKASAEICPNISYGVLAVAPKDADMTAFEPLNPDSTSAVEQYVVSSLVDKKYGDFNLIINNFSKDSAYYETPLVMCAYVTDGEKVDYLCHNEYNEITQQPYASAITFKFIAEECAPKHIVTFACDSTMGTLSGETSQVVTEGEKTTTVTATANEGYQFACWSDGTQSATIEYSPTSKTNLVAYFTPESTGLPVVTINTTNGISISSKDYYVGCEITLLDTETGKSIGGETAEIKGRGNSTWEKFDKKPYKFKFESKQNLFGYGKEKTWVLLADARDYSLIRNMLALNAGLSLSELEYNSMGQSVELYLNGEYKGVYYLCEQIQVKENRVNITQEDEDLVQGPADLGYLIEMDAWAADSTNQSGTANYTADGDVYVTVPDSLNSNRAYVIKDPEDILFDADGNLKADFLDYVQGFLADGIAAVQGTDYATVCELIDVKSFAQAYIIFELFKNPDVNYSSVYFYKDVNGKIVSAPLWDFDMSVGNVTHKSGAGTNAQNFRDTTFLWTASQNPWFKGLLKFDEFKALVGQELADNADNIRASIAADLAYAREHADAYKKNFEVWNLIGNTSATVAMGAWSIPDEFKAFETWEEHLDYIEEYLEASLTYLITTYPAPAAE